MHSCKSVYFDRNGLKHEYFVCNTANIDKISKVLRPLCKSVTCIDESAYLDESLPIDYEQTACYV